MKLLKYRHIMMGFVIGSIVTVSATVFAQTLPSVSAILANNITFKFDEQDKAIPAGYSVLLYNGRTYVPARFVAENLGATVDWDDSTRVIRITSPVKEETVKENPQPVQEEKKEEIVEVKRDYKKLPITKRYIDMTITATLVALDDNEARLYLSLENKENLPLQILQRETVAVVGKKEYKTKDLPLFKLDAQWFNDVQKDDIVEGYITLPTIPKDAKEIHIKLVVLTNNSSQEKREVELDIAL